LFLLYYSQVTSLIKSTLYFVIMADTNRRVPLWLIALVGGLGVFTILGLFIYGSYAGLGSSL
jgi:photosystem II PsbJ protein